MPPPIGATLVGGLTNGVITLPKSVRVFLSLNAAFTMSKFLRFVRLGLILSAGFNCDNI